MHVLSIGVKKKTLFLEHVYFVGVSINESIQLIATYWIKHLKGTVL